ncbi:hypothetical protein E2C01_007688 [Portunus trituberculatus]|uniref:Uncharacterized protein n=1 Tax=Portunus trituberculatus TaxID=210409 RepID=A0A5B7CZX4_PORTR|nr:hypothetical protein [Portunus trituberculatus]
MAAIVGTSLGSSGAGEARVMSVPDAATIPCCINPGRRHMTIVLQRRDSVSLHFTVTIKFASFQEHTMGCSSTTKTQDDYLVFSKTTAPGILGIRTLPVLLLHLQARTYTSTRSCTHSYAAPAPSRFLFTNHRLPPGPLLLSPAPA